MTRHSDLICIFSFTLGWVVSQVPSAAVVSVCALVSDNFDIDSCTYSDQRRPFSLSKTHFLFFPFYGSCCLEIENYASWSCPYIKSFIFWHYSRPQIPVSIRNDFIPVRNEFIPFWNEFIPFRNTFIPVHLFS